jgi:hypothetical protein
MTSINRPVDYMTDRTAPVAMTSYHDQVRWGPILGGLVVALSTQLVLSALGAAVGLSSIGGSGTPRSAIGQVGVNIGIWSIVSLFISLFMGGWITGRTAGRMGRNSALLNGAILWASMLALSAWLLSSGVTGAFGIVASNASSMMERSSQMMPSSSSMITAQETRDLASSAAKASGSFVLGALLGLGAALLGAGVGFRHPRRMNEVLTPLVDDRD